MSGLPARVEFAVDHHRDEAVLLIACDELPMFRHRMDMMALVLDTTGAIGQAFCAFVDTYRDGTVKGKELHERITPLVAKMLEAHVSDPRSPLRSVLRGRRWFQWSAA